MTTLLVILGILIVVPPLLGSMTVCAPKWYKNKVAHTPVGRGFSKIRGVARSPVEIGVFGDIISGLGILVMSPVILAIIILVLWVDAWRILIYKGCPYTDVESAGESPFLDFWALASDGLERLREKVSRDEK